MTLTIFLVGLFATGLCLTFLIITLTEMRKLQPVERRITQPSDTSISKVVGQERISEQHLRLVTES